MGVASQGGETAGAKGVVSASKGVASAASVGVTTSAKAEAKAKGVASARFEVEHELAVAEWPETEIRPETETTSCSWKLVGRREVVGVFWADLLVCRLRLPLEAAAEAGGQHFEASQASAGTKPGPFGQFSTQSSSIVPALSEAGW